MPRLQPGGKSATKSGRRLSAEALIRRLEDCWDEPSLPDSGRRDVEGLQGTWEAVSSPQPMELLVAGSRFAVRFKGGNLYMGSFELEPGSQPKTMLMQIEEGPQHHRGKTARCPYDLDGGTLRWWLPEPGSQEKPASYPEATDRRYIAVVLRRDDAH